MDERTIIIADRNAGYRSQLATHFENAGYRVETAASVAALVRNTLENRQTVLLLETAFDLNVSTPKLIHLLKMCNSGLKVIVVCDDMSLALARQLRSEGLFYHALRPETVEDAEELNSAVACAFNTAAPAATLAPVEATLMPSGFGRQAARLEPARHRLSELCWLFGLTAIFFGACYLALASLIATSAMMWLFLGFCALVIANQLLPIFCIKLPAALRARRLAKQQGASPHGK